MGYDARFNIEYTGQDPDSVDERLTNSATLLPTIAADMQLQVAYEKEVTVHGPVKHKMALSIGHHHAYLVATNHGKDRNVSCSLQDPGGRFGKHFSRLRGNRPWIQLLRETVQTLITKTEVPVPTPKAEATA